MPEDVNNIEGEEEKKPWWKRMKKERGKVKDPYGRTTHGVKFSVKGDGFLHELITTIKGWFR